MSRSMDMLPDWMTALILGDYENRQAARASGLQPCRSPYCECDVGKCTHPGFYDSRGVDPVWEKAWDDLSPQRGS